MQSTPRLSKIILLTGILGIAAGTLGIRLSHDISWIRFFDNLHWTAATSVAALLAWISSRQYSPGDARSLFWITLGLSGYAIGQILWDIQMLVGYTGFASPADLFYLWLGPCITIGLLQEIRQNTSDSDRKSAWLDTLTLMVAMITLVLVMYLPKRGDTPILPLLILIAYPATLLSATCAAIIMAITLRLRANAGLLIFICGLVTTALSWMHWNSRALDGVAIDGDWFNISFSVAVLSIGYSLTRWKIERVDNPRFDRFCEGTLRSLPLATVVIASLTVILSSTLPNQPAIIQTTVNWGAALVILLATIRQASLLRERDYLISARKALQETQMQLSHERGLLKSLVGTIPDLVWLKDPDGVYLNCNPKFEEFFGAKEYEILGKTDYDFVDKDLADFFRKHDKIAMKADKPSTNEEWLTFAIGGHHGLFETIKTPMRDENGRLIGVLGIAREVTERKLAEQQIEQLAFYDVLTGLPNRRLLLDRLNQALALSARSGEDGALLFLDLDNFKTLNDSLGHRLGDLLLKEVAARLAGCLREGDTVARLGGDEFVILLQDLSTQDLEAAAQAEMIANKILAAISVPFQLDANQYHSTSSIGITLFNNHQYGADEILQQADIAMYQAKKSGRNNLRFFDRKMQEAIALHASLESELRAAIDRQQFLLYYQIQVDGSNRPYGAEALMRWLHPQRGLIPPMQFIPLAEETGLILPIGDWVLETACAQIKAWQQDAATCHLMLSVNVSAKQFHQKNFVSQVEAAIRRHDIPPQLLKLEITESMLLDNTEAIITSMQALKSLDIRFSLDDFGTGYSSLQYLKRLPLDQLKIDQSFINDIVDDPHDRSIVRTIIAMAQSLELDVIAEGVETEDQRQCLIQQGCTHFQGYLFGKPVSLDAFETSLKQAP